MLVRCITQDDPEQSAHATQLVESLDEDNPGFVSIVALVELYRVLRSAYKTTRADAAAVVKQLLVARELRVQEPDAVRRSLTRLTDTVDFPDAMISELGTLAGCDHTATFDRQAAQIRGMRLLGDGQ